MTAMPPTSTSSPLGSSSGWALDVIIVAPSPNCTKNGVAASSDFYASFPSSLSRKNSLTSTTKRLKSFGSKKSSSNVSTSSNVSSSAGGEDELTSERSIERTMSSSTSTSQPNVSISVAPPMKGNVQVRINGRYISKLDMIFSKKNGNTSSCRFVNGNGLRPSVETLNMILNGTQCNDDATITCTCSEAVRNSEHHLCANNNNNSNNNGSTPNGEAQSKELILNFGRNHIRYTLISERGVAIASTEAYIYVWSALDSVIVSDIDGTVTKDNVGGVMDTVVQDKFSHIHKGICKFYSQLTMISPVEDVDTTNSSDEVKGQVRFMYLSSRPISLVAQTRKLLVSVSQTCEENLLHSLPPGPMMCNVVPLSSVLYSELVAKNVHQFKSDVLARQVILPFVAARGDDWRKVTTAKSSRSLHVTELDEINETNARCFSDNFDESFKNERAESVPILRDDRLFLAGFGNTMRDAMAYEMAGMDRNDIYIIDPKSRIMCMGEQVSRNQSIEEIQFNNSECLDTEWISDVVDGVCCPGVSDSQDDESLNGEKELNSTDEKKVSSTRAVFDETFRGGSGGGGGLKKSKKLGGSVSQSIRAFTNKKSFNKFPSFASSTSSKSNSSKKLYQGYDDPRLLDAVRRRMQCSDDDGVNSDSVQRMTV